MSATTESRQPLQTSGSPASDSPRDAAALICVLVSLVAAAFVVDAFWWSAGRGFDLTDESFHLNTLRHASVAPQGGSQFGSIVRILTLGQTLSVAEYRLLGLVLLELSAIAAAIAFVKFVRGRLPGYAEHLPSTLVVAATAMVGGTLGYSWLPRTVSYLVLTPTFLTVIAALSFILLANQRTTLRLHRNDVLCTLGIGVATSLLFFTKFSSAVAAMVVAALAVLVLDGWRRALLLSSVAGGVFVVATFVLDATSEFSLRELFQRASALGGGSHSASALRKAYWTEFRDLLPPIVVGSVALGLVLAGAWLILRRRGKVRFAIAAAFVVVGALMFRRAVGASRPPWDLSTIVFFSALGAVVLAVVLAAVADRRLGSGASDTESAREEAEASPAPRRGGEIRGGVAVAVLLAGLPLAGALGTNTGLLKMSLSTGALLALAAIALVTMWRAALPDDARRSWLVALPLVVVLVCGSVVVGRALLRDLYRVPFEAGQQTRAVPGAKPLAGLRVDRPTRTLVEQVVTLASRGNRPPPGSPILTSGNLEGFAYALDGYVPGTGWIDGSETTCARLKKSRKVLSETQVLIVSDPMGAALENCFRGAVPGFPDDFRSIGAVDVDPARQREIGVKRVEVLRRNPS